MGKARGKAGYEWRATLILERRRRFSEPTLPKPSYNGLETTNPSYAKLIQYSSHTHSTVEQNDHNLFGKKIADALKKSLAIWISTMTLGSP
jgi:hypothetical protein